MHAFPQFTYSSPLIETSLSGFKDMWLIVDQVALPWKVNQERRLTRNAVKETLQEAISSSISDRETLLD